MTLTVRLADRSYPIRIAADLSQTLRETVAAARAAGRRVAAITDANVARHQGAFLLEVLGGAPLLELPPGEETKSLSGLGRCLDFLAENKIDRGGLLLAAGGGVIGDLAGFAAATWLRGIAFIQVPTTLLAMVDSSVGGKTGINLKAGKNLAGAFHQPAAVFISTDLLRTLPPREFAAGMAEVLKDALLADGGLFARLEREPLVPGGERVGEVIRRCCEIKAAVVAADERETAADDGRALLNLGHTFGHAIEQATGYGAYLHGEAVAIGLVAAARLSEKLGCLNADEVARIRAVLVAHKLPVALREPLPLGALMAAAARDKKVRDASPRFVVLTSLGVARTRDNLPREWVEDCFRAVGAEADASAI